MKKLLLMLAVMLTTVGAWAQTKSYTRIADFESERTNSTVYALKATRSPIYFSTEHNELAGYWTSSSQALQGSMADATQPEQQFAFLRTVNTEEGKYYMYSVAGACFITTSGDKSESPEPIAWFKDVTDKDDANHQGMKLYLGVTGDNVVNMTWWSNNTAGGIRYNTNSECDAGNVFEIIACDQTLSLDDAIAAIEEVEANTATVTYNYVYEGVQKYQEVIEVLIGSEYPDYNQTFPYGIVAEAKPEGIVEADEEVEITLSVNLPFEVSTDYATAHWYALKIRDDGFTYLSYDSSKEYIPASATAYSLKSQNNYMWAFIGNPFDGFKVINKAAGDAKILSAPSAPTGDKNAGQLARMVEETGATGNIVWNLKAPTHNNAVANVFYIEHPTATSYAFNRQSFNSENALCYWNKRDTGSAMLVEEAYDFSQFGDLLFNDEQMQDGKIYRIQSSTRKTFTGIDGYTCNMKNQDYDVNNPGQLWKYVVDGDKAYLQNVYAGLYPQYVVGGGDQTTAIGTSKDYAFTYSINNANVEHIWNIFFGGRQVNIEGNGNVNWWTGENAHHCIYEVEATDEELATMCMNWYNANQYVAPEATASSYQKIAIDANATEIISPSEFAAPSDINEAIDNLAAIEGTLGMEITSAGDIHTLFGALSVYAPAVSALTAYKNAVTANGELLSILYTPKAEWGTIILPINWANPEGWGRYTCAKTEGNLLTLADFAGGASKNTPMIIQVAEDKIGTTYQMIGYSNNAGTENVTAGLLTGVLEDNTFVPEGSYVLSKYNGKIGFYPVSAGTNYEASKYKCFLTLPAASARYNALYFDETETGIIETEGENAKAEIYDMSGRRVQKVQKGLYIVNGVKVIK